MVTLFYDCYSILNKVYGDKAFIKQAIADTPIEEKNRAATVKICYGVLDKDAELSYYISNLADKTPKLPVRTILKIAMYAIKYLGKKNYAVIKNAVELTKKLGKGGASGFVNAFLRNFDKSEIPLPSDETEKLCVKYSYPRFAAEELIKTYGIERTESIISAPNSETTLSFYDTDGEKYLSDRKIEYEKTPFNNVFYVKRFVRNDDYDKGIYTYQAIGSVAICDAVEPCEKLLDCCAAPGGKSVRLSYKCKKITSWDIHPHRTALIEDYKRRMKRENVTSATVDAKVYDERYKESFDAVLVDAPCSGLGVAADNPDIKINRKEENLKEIVAEQFAILNTVSEYVKRGGFLYYSTCSVLPSENIEVVNRFLEEKKDFVIQPIDSPLPHENMNGTNAFLPDISGGSGFFIAKLKKL